MELLGRLLPRPPAQVLDVGGGPGTYAAPLARRGYRVHLCIAQQARLLVGGEKSDVWALAMCFDHPHGARPEAPSQGESR